MTPAQPKNDLVPGIMIKRLTPSSTARNIVPGDVGRIGGINPALHLNPARWDSFSYFPVQWLRNGLWSAMDGTDEDYTWEYLNKPPEEEDEFEDDEELKEAE